MRLLTVALFFLGIVCAGAWRECSHAEARADLYLRELAALRQQLQELSCEEGLRLLRSSEADQRLQGLAIVTMHVTVCLRAMRRAVDDPTVSTHAKVMLDQIGRALR